MDVLCKKELFSKRLKYSLEHTGLESLFHKVADLPACKSIKRRLQERCWRNTNFDIHLRRADFMKWLFGTLFLDSRIQNHPDTIILQNYQSLSNQSFKRNSAHLLSLYLTLTLSFEPSFFTFIINGYYAESKHLLSLDSFFWIF